MPRKYYREDGIFYRAGIIEAACRAVIGLSAEESGMF